MEIAVSGGGDVVFFADVFHVAFGAFELSGFGAGAEGGDVCGFQCVGEAFYQGLFGPDDDKGDGVFLAEGKDVGMGGKIHTFDVLADATIAGGAEHFLYRRGLFQAPAQGVFAATGADYQKFCHLRRFPLGWGFIFNELLFICPNLP